MNKKITYLCIVTLLAAITLATGAFAQTKAYRQANLTSSVSSGAPNTSASLSGPGAIAFLPGQPFFIADSGSGSIGAENPSGSDAAVIGVAAASGKMGQSAPLGIASDASGAFGPAGSPFQYVVVTGDGTIQGFTSAGGKTPFATTLVRDGSAVGAVYTAVALVHPDCCAPFAAVANFEDGAIHTFSSSFEPLNLSGSFHDPNLPAGYAPYGLEVIGKQLFVAYAVQNAARNAAIAGAGNGIVDIFDLQGNFVRRFAVGGSLNAPWGITIATANFGPLSGAVLVGNSGDGTISAFDSATGNFLGQVTDGDGNPIVNAAIHGLTFRSDGTTDPNTLFFTAANANGSGGLFGAITAGLVSATRASASSPAANKSAVITATVAAGPGNSGTPTGTAMLSDGGVAQGTATVMNGVATFTLPGMKAGMHTILVQYSGDAAFLPSSSQTEMHVAAATTPSFTVAASPSSVTVSAGQSAQVTVTVTPSGGFASSVSFSCSSVPGVTCAFSPATVTPSSGPATTAMTVNVAMSVPRYGSLPFGLTGAGGSLAVLVFLMLAFWRSRNFQRSRIPVLATLAMLFLFAASLTIAGCGSYSAPQNAGPASLTVTAMSGAISQTATVSLTVQ